LRSKSRSIIREVDLPPAFLGCVTRPREIVSNAKSVEDKKTRFMRQRKLTALETEKKSLQKSKKKKEKKKHDFFVPLLDGTEKRKRNVNQGAMINVTIVAFYYSILERKW